LAPGAAAAVLHVDDEEATLSEKARVREENVAIVWVVLRTMGVMEGKPQEGRVVSTAGEERLWAVHYGPWRATDRGDVRGEEPARTERHG
jgi:hypothetical protein